MKPSKAIVRCLRWQFVSGLALALGLAPALRAVVIDFGDIKGSFDTTISVGGLYRMNSPDRQLYGLANGGLQKSVNADDGDLNYKKGMASFLVMASNDLLLNYKDSAGLYVSGYYFDDFINTDYKRGHIPLSSDANSIVGKNAELLDAYLFFKSAPGDMPASLRIGRQVLSWGESTFIPNGINSVNPVDVAKLRTPGSELKEALLPVDMVSASLSLTKDLTLEAFYLLEWERTRIDPPGSYFSTNDFVARGGTKVYLGFGGISDSSPLGAIMRGKDVEPGSSGQYGVNLRWLAHGLKDTEFSFYYMNYHSRLPMVSARTPTQPVDTTAVAAAVLSAATRLGTAQLLPVLLANGVPSTSVVSTLSTLVGAALTNVPAAALPASLQPFYAQAQAIAFAALNDPTVNAQKTLAFLTAAATGEYLVEFPKDIHLYGASFNTSVNGVAVQGELSYRPNQPLQVDDVELLFAALSPLNPAYGPNNQLGNYAGQYGTYISGYRRNEVWTGQLTATKVSGGILGAQQSTFLAEVGFVHANLPAKGKLRYDGFGTYVAGDINEMINTGNAAFGADPASAFADSFSWGYELVGRLDYNNVFAGINISPLLVFTHDVSGNTPLPMGNFEHNRKSITVGAEFTFQNAWAFDLRYVNFFGGGRFNLLGDRDYVACNLKYSF